MTAAEIDHYLSALDEPKRSTLVELRRTITALLPEAEEGISYRMPAFSVQGKVIAGFAAFKNHLSYFPHSGSVVGELMDELSNGPFRAATKSTVQFPIDVPLPRELVEKLIAVRLRQAFPDQPQ
jgi:uncharacterized protein YdhG (YjbR/CyaY superfamily)